MIRMHVAFSQFQNADHEIHVDDLAQPLRFQGYVRVDPDVCVDLAYETTPYSTLAFAEYVKFVDTFAAYEKEEMRKEFDSFDDDGSGCLSLDELRRVLNSLGITPLKETLNDAMAIVDFDKSGELDFDEFVHLMAIYRVTDGFSKKEIGELKDIFFRLAVEVKFKYWEIQPDRLFDAMVYIFGPQSNDLAQKFIVDQRFRDSREMDMQGLSFMEFIIWARKLREAEIDEYRKEFEEADEDASGLLGFEEIRDVISKLGYRPLRKLIKEVIEEVDFDRDNQLDFDEFVNLMQAFRRTDGFNAVEVNELSDAFHRFANVGAQNLDSIQLLDVMRYLGYVTNLDTVRRFLVAVDIDRSGSLNMPKFLRIMRMNREAELTEAHNCFIGKSDRDSRLPHGKLHAALNEIGYTLGDKMHEQLEQGISTLSDPESLDFDDFVHILDHCRKALVALRRTHAFFSKEDIKKYRKAFNAYDIDGSGDIEKLELSKLLQDLGVPMGTKKDQQDMFVKLDIAREKARAAGVEEHLVGNNGDPALTFHPFLFLLRMVHRVSDESEVDRDTMMSHQTKFSQAEINQFREFFTFWAAKVAAFERATTMDAEADDEQQPVLSALLSKDGAEEQSRNMSLSIDGMQRVVRSLGLHMNQSEKKMLYDHIDNLPRVDQKKFEFFEFLLLMRWMLDVNFAEIHSVLRRQAEVETDERIVSE